MHFRFLNKNVLKLLKHKEFAIFNVFIIQYECTLWMYTMNGICPLGTMLFNALIHTGQGAFYSKTAKERICFENSRWQELLFFFSFKTLNQFYRFSLVDFSISCIFLQICKLNVVGFDNLKKNLRDLYLKEKTKCFIFNIIINSFSFTYLRLTLAHKRHTIWFTFLRKNITISEHLWPYDQWFLNEFLPLLNIFSAQRWITKSPGFHTTNRIRNDFNNWRNDPSHPCLYIRFFNLIFCNNTLDLSLAVHNRPAIHKSNTCQ